MISIIIPTIGRAHTFLDALQSAITCESNYVDEIIIADNSQNLEFAKILDSYLVLDNRIKVIRYDVRVNMATSWNMATSNVKNDWVIYLHDDDVLYSESINIASKYTLDNIAFVYCDFDIDNSNRVTKWRYNHDVDGLSDILEFNPRFVSTIINKKALISIGGWNEKFGYALDLVAFLLMASEYKIIHGNCILGSYRLHENNLSSKKLRNREYGDVLGYIIETLFLKFKDENIRRKIIRLLIDFIYPEKNNICNRIIFKYKRIIKYLF